MNIHFKLRTQGNRDPIIVLHVFDSRFKARKFMHSTGLSIKQILWDKRRNRAKPAPAQVYEDEMVKLNKHLDKIEKDVIHFLGERHGVSQIDRIDLKKYLARKSNLEKGNEHATENPSDFFLTWGNLIETTKNSSGVLITNGTKRSKKQTLSLLKDFCLETDSSLTFENLDMKFYHGFDAFMIEKGLCENSRGKHFKEIKAILREADDRDILINQAFRKKSFKVIRTRPDNVYLNDDEIKKIYDLKLSPAQEKLRDIFVMACYVGARHSDWSQIRKENIVVESNTEMLRIRQTKTKTFTHVPIHSAVRSILNKYKGNAPAVITNQKFNEALKTICKKAKLGTISRGQELIEKWEEISTHTARRSFATNAYLSKSMDVYQIMHCTGHKSESSFLRYLKLDGKDFAIQAADSKFFKDDSWSSLKVAS